MSHATVNESRAEEVRQDEKTLDVRLKDLAAQMEEGRPESNRQGQDNVACIVQTYELSRALREKIQTVAARRCGDGRIPSFSDQYEYVAELVERFTAPYPERFAIRLDQPAFEDSRRTHHDLIGTENSGLKQLILGKSQRKALHAHEIVDILQTHLPAAHLDFLADLLRNRAEASLWQFSADRIRINMRSIAQTLKRLEERHGRNGRIIMPPRPIKSVTRRSNGELAIRYGDRRYKGDPLAFFEQHREVYGGLTRAGLYRFDQGLYQTLRSSGQLDQAIPRKAFDSGRPFPSDKVEKIIKTFQQNGNLAKTARMTGCCVPTVRKYAKLQGLKVKLGRKG